MSIPKEDIEMDKIVNLLKKSKNDTSFYDVLYDLYVYIGIAKGINDIRNGNGITLEEFNKEREALYESYSRRFG